jgi:hypothetical protein
MDAKGIALIAMAALVGLSWPARAAVGDVIWIGVREDGPDLSGAQKVALATLINSDWGAGTASGLDSEKCHQTLMVAPVWRCTVAAEKVLTDEEYLAKRIAGEIQPGQPTTIVTDSMVVAADYSAWALDVFNVPLDELYVWRAWRDAATPTVVHTAYWPIKTDTLANFRAADSAQPQQVLQIVGRITE